MNKLKIKIRAKAIKTPEAINKIPKVLLFDIETSPNFAKIWAKYEQNAVGDFIQERMIICVAWKWLGSNKVESMALPNFYGYKKYVDKNYVRKIDNIKLIYKLHKLMSEADIIIAQNGDNFDVKMANAEFIEYGLDPPPPYKTIDTLKVARNKFKFNSNKLDDIGARLGLGRKMHTGGVSLWEGCLRGEKQAWDHMIKYNIQDVILLEKIYLKFRPWMTTHPNMNAFNNSVEACPVCMSSNLIKKGWQLSPTGKWQRYKCMDCGHCAKGNYESAQLAIR